MMKVARKKLENVQINESWSKKNEKDKTENESQ